ncbi:MAG: hypothetical protein GFH24_608346n22 [Chloroflexi bacterium AL-N5]|nr:hypothetical protein [Chloroflexi bacterium AL-N5]
MLKIMIHLLAPVCFESIGLAIGFVIDKFSPQVDGACVCSNESVSMMLEADELGTLKPISRQLDMLIGCVHVIITIEDQCGPGHPKPPIGCKAQHHDQADKYSQNGQYAFHVVSSVILIVFSHNIWY